MADTNTNSDQDLLAMDPGAGQVDEYLNFETPGDQGRQSGAVAITKEDLDNAKRYKHLQAEFTKKTQEWSKKDKDLEAFRKAEPILKALEKLNLKNSPPEEVESRLAFHDNLQSLLNSNPQMALNKFLELYHNSVSRGGNNGNSPNGNWNTNGPGMNQFPNTNTSAPSTPNFNSGWGNTGGQQGQPVDELARAAAYTANLNVSRLELTRDIDTLKDQYKTKYGIEINPNDVLEELSESKVTFPNKKQVESAIFSRYQEEIENSLQQRIQNKTSESLKRGYAATVFPASGSENPIELSEAALEATRQKKPENYNQGYEMALAELKRGKGA